ncbi:Rqc2 family fibronectin-binding protein [Desulfurispora thermophila]|uniref:Rqc2 family fibronectin-binding protein n=1 Tax=Desulfurispora thermophila TaxID=265470 RepID=UPI00036868C6|nr:NFACT RNA binding domain-containing protein [Desulfurispora thermophila]
MPFDSLVLAAVCRELDQTITGYRIDRVFQPSGEEVHLLLHSPRGNARLLLSAHARLARVHLTKHNKPNPVSPPAFCMLLRKHLEGGRITGVTQQGLDRVLLITIEALDDLGRLVEKKLVCEIMGKHSNIILLDDRQQIIDGIRRYSHSVSRHREVLPGRPYIAPPAQPKAHPLNLEEEQFAALLLERDWQLPVPAALQQILDGVSPALAREICFRAGLEPNALIEHCGQYEITSLWRTGREIFSHAAAGRFEPCLAWQKKKPLDFAAVRLTHLTGCRLQAEDSMMQVIDTYYHWMEKQEKTASLKQSLLAFTRREIARLEKKIALQQESLRAAEEADKWRIYGELVTANLYRLQKGDRVLEAENYYQPDCPLVSIPLDPQLTPARNAQAFFKKYNKARATQQAATTQLSQSRSELAYLREVETAINLAEEPETLQQIRQELVEEGYLAPESSDPRTRKNEKASSLQPQPIKIFLPEGLSVLVGKNNRQNDFITMRLARPEDIWLHAKDIPGAHVIIRTEGKPVPASALLQAACLAAHFSQAREATTVPVDYTQRKNVRKPKGAKPGYVIYEEQKTLYVRPDPDLVEKLLSNEISPD